jgi:trimethylguanosine synthase
MKNNMDACPFGPQYQMFWNMRYSLFSKFDETQVDAGGLYTMVPEAYALDMAKNAKGNRILDVCSGIGSMSIAFARKNLNVTSVEIDQAKINMAHHNAKIYGVDDKINFVCGDITSRSTLNLLPKDTDTLWMDPPWGSSVGDYLKKSIIRIEDLKLANTDLRDLARFIPCQYIMMRLPRNFDLKTIEAVSGKKLRYVEKNILLWYFLIVTKDEFINIG